LLSWTNSVAILSLPHVLQEIDGELTLLFSDISYTFRIMRRTPLFTATMVLTVMLAIAANVIIFSFVNAVMLRPLPFREPSRLVQVAEKNDKLNLPTFGSSVLNFLDWREQSKSFDELAAVGFNNYTLTGTGEPEQFSGNRISPALTRVLGIPPIAGRAFSDDEEQPGAPSVAMIGEGLWKRRFGADQGLIGRTIILNDTPTTVVGIAPAALNLISGGDVYTPLTIDRSKEIRLNHVIFTVGRLKHGVSIERAQAEMAGISARMGRQYPQIRDWGIHLVSLFDTFVSRELGRGLCAADCLRKHRQPTIGASRHTAERNGGADGHRREPQSAGASIAGRKRDAFLARRYWRAWRSALGGTRDQPVLAAEHATHPHGRNGCQGVLVCAGVDGHYRADFWNHSGVAHGQGRSQRGSQARWAWLDASHVSRAAEWLGSG
jgi:hypothetical protein